jgi:CheY-like chemotaxis protein
MELPLVYKINKSTTNNNNSINININSDKYMKSDIIDDSISLQIYEKEVDLEKTNDEVEEDTKDTNSHDINNIIKKILIVDDASTNRKMLKRLLDDRIENILEADDGNIAVDIMKDMINSNELPIDIILMDFVMPNMSGPDATRIIRELGYNGIIIGVTGNNLPCDIEHFKLAGANDVLAKPLNMEKLELLVQSNKLFYNIFIFNNIVNIHI